MSSRAALRWLFDPSQPRVPAGSPQGGQWTNGLTTSAPTSPWTGADGNLNSAGLDVWHDTVERLHTLVGYAYVAKTPVAMKAAQITADVLAEMKTKGYVMPAELNVTHDQYVHGALTHVPGTTGPDGTLKYRQVLRIFVPDTIPPEADLDAVARAEFEGTEAARDPLYPTYDKFTIRSFKDIVVHEMGHMQDAVINRPRFTPDGVQMLDQDARKTVGSRNDVYRAMKRVSWYAYGENSDAEFVAEAFTRLYRGETLPDDSLRLYRALHGPEVKP